MGALNKILNDSSTNNKLSTLPKDNNISPNENCLNGEIWKWSKKYNSSNRKIFGVVADLLKLPFSLYSVNLGLPIKYQMTNKQATSSPNIKNMSLEEN
jgi:hypothetical protein